MKEEEVEVVVMACLLKEVEKIRRIGILEGVPSPGSLVMAGEKSLRTESALSARNLIGKKDCPNLKKKEEDGSSSFAVEKYVSDDVLYAAVSYVSDHWVLDSMASFHMTPNKDYFSSFVV